MHSINQQHTEIELIYMLFFQLCAKRNMTRRFLNFIQNYLPSFTKEKTSCFYQKSMHCIIIIELKASHN